jgi:hypothetical protein
VVKNSVDNLIVVYGSPYEETNMDFINELHLIMGNCHGLTLVGGDFNIVRIQKEKNNNVIIFTMVNSLNEWINS